MGRKTGGPIPHQLRGWVQTLRGYNEHNRCEDVKGWCIPKIGTKEHGHVKSRHVVMHGVRRHGSSAKVKALRARMKTLAGLMRK